MKTAEIFERIHRPHVEPRIEPPVDKPTVRLLTPSEIPPRRTTPEPPAPTPWPPRATATAVVLAVVALVLGVAAIVGFATGDEATDPELEQAIATLTVERDDLTAEVATLDEAMTELTDARDGLDRQVASLDGELDAALAEGERLLIETDVQAGTIDDLDATVSMLVDDIAQVNDELALQREDTLEAVAERDTLLDLFPIGVDAELDPDVVPGAYDVAIDEVYCVGLDNCGTVPTIDELTIRETADDRLELVIVGYPVAGLAEVDGVLFAAMDLTVTEADGTTRVARTMVTIFADDVTVADDGVQTVTNLEASLTMAAPSSGSHPVGAAVFAMELTPQN